MSRVINTLNQLEIRLQNLVENSTAKIFPRFVSSRYLATLLEEAIKNGLSEGENMQQTAANIFYLKLHPQHAALIQKDVGWIEQLELTLLGIEEYSSFVFFDRPVVRIVASDELELGEIQVSTEFSLKQNTETAGNPVDQKLDATVEELQGFLIVNGTDLFSLNQPVVNIGRRSDNQLVLEDSRVSRVHAQIRVVNQNYVIFDLESSGGTWINGERVRQQKLVPGDVISLAGVPLVFGFEVSEQGATTDIRPVNPGGAEKE